METGNKNVINHLKLIFNLDYNSFKYSIFNSDRNCFEKIITHNIHNERDEIISEIQSIIQNDINLSKKYPVCLGSIDMGTSTFIPDALFEKTYLQNYIYLTSQIETDKCMYFKQTFSDCFSVFGANQNLLKMLKESFNKLTLKNISSILVDYALHLNEIKKIEIFTIINNEDFHIALIHNKKFIFYNKFKFITEDDFLYHFLNCLKTLELNPNKIQINILSDLEKDNNLFKKLRKYINHLKFINRPAEFLYENEVMELASHKHHNLFSQLICE